jgi:hypothetical protein
MGAESPTTARELDFDDDNEASAQTLAHDNRVSPPPTSKSPKPGVRFSEDATEIPPPKPPRPMSPHQQAENTLIEAFPGIDTKVVKAVLVASGGKVEPAFNALLSTTPSADTKGSWNFRIADREQACRTPTSRLKSSLRPNRPGQHNRGTRSMPTQSTLASSQSTIRVVLLSHLADVGGEALRHSRDARTLA